MTFRPWAWWAFQLPLRRSALDHDSRARAACAGIVVISHSSWSLTSAVVYKRDDKENRRSLAKSYYSVKVDGYNGVV